MIFNQKIFKYFCNFLKDKIKVSFRDPDVNFYSFHTKWEDYSDISKKSNDVTIN